MKHEAVYAKLEKISKVLFNIMIGFTFGAVATAILSRVVSVTMMAIAVLFWIAEDLVEGYWLGLIREENEEMKAN